MLRITKQMTTEQIDKLANLAREAGKLCWQIEAIEFKTGDRDELEFLNDLYNKASYRMWRRINALRDNGHTEALW